jgi:alpha-galactosidase
MKALGEYIHSRGLKFGIYSSPGPYTCGGYEGSHGHEEQDARTFAEWGIDLLKYDWCSARRFYETQQEMQALYQKMGDALGATGRPIVYALCQYGMFDVGKWGRKVGANQWRTTFDMRDDWKAMTDIGFAQNGKEADAGPGAWNDPDMLQAGLGGMSLDEYRTQITLWSILAAPLLLSHDPRNMTPELTALLTNRDVIAVNQDRLGKQGHRVWQRGEAEVWTRPLSDGATAVALFNRGATPADLEIRWSELGLGKAAAVRDLWQQQDLGPQRERYRAALPPHGTVLLRVTQRRA